MNDCFLQWIRSRGLFFLSLVALSLFTVAIVIGFTKYARKIGGDFDMRYNEVHCILDGKDPYVFWQGEEVSDTYYAGPNTPAGKQGISSANATRKVDIYTPWEYTFFYPFSLFSERMASMIWTGLCIVSLLGMGWCAIRTGKAIRNNLTDMLFCLSAVFAIAGKGLNSCLATQNFPLVFAGLLFLMVFLLEHHRKILAGLAWAVLMSKPQTAALLFFPLLLGKEWKVIIVAAITCLLATVPPAVFTGTSPVSLVLHVAEMSGIVEPTPFFPPPLFSLVSISFGHTTAAGISAAIGIMICGFISFIVGQKASWRLRFSLAVICSLCWTYKRAYDWCLLALPLLVLAEGVCSAQSVKIFAIRLFALGCLMLLPFVPPQAVLLQTVGVIFILAVMCIPVITATTTTRRQMATNEG